MRRFHRIFGFFIIVTCFIGVWGCSSGSDDDTPSPQIPYNIQTVNDISYIAGDEDPKHRLDVYYPTQVTHPSVIFFVHGGAWRQGDKSMYPELGKAFSMYYGFTVVITNYRLSNEEDGNAVFPDHINDVAAAFAWVKKNIAAYGGDPDQVFAFGQSAGGHLVSLLATDSAYLRAEGYDLNDIKGVISMSGAYDLADLAQFPVNPVGLTADEVLMYEALFQSAFGGWDNALLASASPQSFISGNQPPFLVIYVDQDLPGFAQEAVNYHAAVSDLKGPAVSLEHLVRSDFSDATWAAATEAAAAEAIFADYVGHYAEIMAITPQEYNSRSTQLVVDFVKTH